MQSTDAERNFKMQVQMQHKLCKNMYIWEGASLDLLAHHFFFFFYVEDLLSPPFYSAIF